MLTEKLDVYKKFTRDTILAGIATAVFALKQLILLPILSKTLGTEAYGIWSQIQLTVLLLVFFAALQLGSAMYRFMAAENDRDKLGSAFFSVLAVTALTSILLSIVVFILAQPLAAAVFGGDQAAPYVRLTAFLVFLTTLDQVIIYYFTARREMAKYSIFIIGQAVGEVALVASLVFSGFSLYGAIAALLVIRAILFIAGVLIVKQQIKFSVPSLSVVKSYLSFSLPLVPAGLCYFIYTSSDRYFIGYFLGIEAVGIYSAAYTLGIVVEFFYVPLSIVLMPAIAYLYDNNRIEEVKMHLTYSLKLYLLLAIPGAVGVSILAKSLLVTLATPEFIVGWLLVPIIALGILLRDCSYIVETVLVLLNRTKIIGLIYITGAVINLVMNIILVPVMGLIGAAISALTTFIVLLIASSVISFKLLPFDIDWKFIAKALISALIMGTIIWVLNSTGAANLLISIAAGALVYFVALILMKSFTKQEYEFLKDILTSMKNKTQPYPRP